MSEDTSDAVRSELRDQLAKAWNLRSNEDQVLWRIFGTFWPTNAILLVALFRSADALPTRWVGAIICASGVFVAVVWFLIQGRAIGHIKRLETTADRLERRLCIPAEFGLSPRLNVADYEAHLATGPRARTVMPACTLLTGVVWSIGVVYFVCRGGG